MTRTCPRCGQSLPVLEVQQTRCVRCTSEVTQIIAADARRRLPRFPARDLTGRTLA